MILGFCWPAISTAAAGLWNSQAMISPGGRVIAQAGEIVNYKSPIIS
jgi:hypothetical protein